MIRTSDREMGDISIWGRYMAWAGADQFGSPANRAQLANLDSGSTRTIARARHGSEIAWVRGDGHFLTYTEQTTKTDTAGVDHYTWHVHLVDLATGRSLGVDSSDTAGATKHLPSPSLTFPWLVWDKAISDTSYDVYAYNIETGKRVRAVHAQNVQDAMATRASVLWIRVDGRPGLIEGDIVQTALPTLTSRVLRSNHRVGRLSVRDEIVAFTELGNDGRSSSVWRMTLGEGSPTLVTRTEAYGVVAGAHFTAWVHGDDLVMQLSGQRSARTLVRGHTSIIARTFATAHRLAFGTVGLDGSSNITSETLHFVNVP